MLPALDTTDEDFVPKQTRKQRPVTIGTPFFGWSPRAQDRLAERRRKLLNTRHIMYPEVVVQHWKNHVYAAVWWWPAVYEAMLRPEHWHTTLVRVWPGADSP